MSIRRVFTGQTVINGQPAEVTLVDKPVVDDVVISAAKVEAYLIEYGFPFTPTRTPFSVRQFLVRLRTET